MVERCQNEKIPLIGVLVDIEKAFDKVNRRLLWSKLGALGCQGPLLEIVKLMYSGPPQLTMQLNKRFSDLMDSTNGVLQGCPLLPLLFIIYLHDIPITSWSDPVLDAERISGLMLADDLLLLSTSSTAIENKLNILEQYLCFHNMRLNASKSWCLNLSQNRGTDPEIWCGDKQVPMAVNEQYNGWLVSASREAAWQAVPHLKRRYRRSLVVAQSLISLNQTLNMPSSSLSTGLYRALVEPELIYACKSPFNAPKSLNFEYNHLQLKFLRFCLDIPFYTVSELVLWDCGQLSLTRQRLQLTPRFFAHVAILPILRISRRALMDSVQLADLKGKGWFHTFWERARVLVPLPLIDDCEGCLVYPDLLDAALRGDQWRLLNAVIIQRATLQTLTWSPPSCSLKKAMYLHLPRHLARVVAMLCFGANNLAVHRLAWEKVP